MTKAQRVSLREKSQGTTMGEYGLNDDTASIMELDINYRGERGWMGVWEGLEAILLFWRYINKM